MKSVKLIFLCSFISGIILFFTGIFFMADIRTASPDNQQTLPTPSGNTTDTGLKDTIDSYAGKDPINFLVLIKEASGLNTDTIIIANYNPETKQISLLTVPRDTKPSGNASYKINSFYYLGLKKYENKKELSQYEAKHKATEYTAQSISNLTGISIDYYIYLEIDTIKEIVDRLGGVYFDIPADLKYTDPTQKLYINLKKGYQLLDGDKTEQFLRFRKSNSRASSEWKKYYDGSDLKRTEMQIKFVNELIKQKVNLLQLPKLIPIINYAFDNVITNVSLSDTLSLVNAFTESSRPEMNTFKLYGVDKRIDNIDYFIYINKVENTKTNKVINSKEVFDTYFASKSYLVIPDKNKSYDFESILNNPSNSETDTYGDNADKP
ncbi:LytR family transcriptional attenuator [Ruminiclostridium sufflavum DSM 19573]|uniref:LytR family transcriptional attenuator n=1 Tax=Ruminiclostridium sufflavum DSM 19573 TaxID=1121337 RepID=A0A318XKE7_9FIRM|nr:LCP family protein [Ruminiclostridium sufflavum]PYG87564.1 LytR family transcriptional attenuator [Ruminiclostridium sufflavum DSM 19573]